MDQDALCDALDQGIVKAAGLDVLIDEPLTKESRIAHYENVILTPHVGAQGVEAIHDIRVQTAESVIRVLEGELPYNCVNKKALLEKRA